MDIAVDKIAIFRTWSDAPLGAVLRIDDVFGLRVEYAGAPGFVILEGKDRGRLEGGCEEPPKEPALDVSELVDIVVEDADPRTGSVANLKQGIAYALIESKEIVVYCIDRLDVALFVVISGEHRGHLREVGTSPIVRLGAVRLAPRKS